MRDQIDKREHMIEQLKKKYDADASLTQLPIPPHQPPGKALSKNSSRKSLGEERKKQAEEIRAEFESRLKVYEEARKKKQEELLSQQNTRYSFVP